ncbi:hypothetical protein, partial [Enterococcus dispar]|uniref:hypothetical protein n=1 Tax=Enterococcus dispar TaxID=44009 RepID=UPI002890F3B7
VRPEPGSNSHKKCLNSQKTVKLNKIDSLLAIACMLFASIKEASYTLVRLLALFSFQRST